MKIIVGLIALLAMLAAPVVAETGGDEAGAVGSGRRAEADAAPRVLPHTVFPRIELADGRILEAARANREDALTVTFLHSAGISKVDKRLLPKEVAALFPIDSAKAVAQAEEAAAQRELWRVRQEEREEELRAREARRQAALADAEARPARASQIPSEPSAEEIEAVASARARQYYEDEKRTGSGQTLVFGVKLRLDEPVEIAGWTHRWRVEGVASYKVYDSLGWGSFSSRANRRFEVTVEAAPGKRPKVLDFTER